MQEAGAYLLPPSQIGNLEKLVTVDGHTNKEWVGKNASKILEAIGKDTKRTWVGTDHGLVSLYLDKNSRWAEEYVF